jgi:hypothetical protein
MSARSTQRIAQAWIELSTDDPEAISAREVAKRRLAAGRELVSLRRLRVFELRGILPGKARIEQLLHRSTQFYNPHKERCTVRLTGRDRPPVSAEERAVLVTERGSEARPSAERWWRHECGEDVRIREGTAWVARFATGDSSRALRELAVLRDRRHGLLANPVFQDVRIAEERVPLEWFDDTVAEATP